MKNNLLAFVCIIICTTIQYSQSNKFGTLNISGGAGIGAYQTNTEYTYLNGGLTFTHKDSSEAASANIYISGDFGIFKRLSIGGYFQNGKYSQEEKAGIIKDNGFYKVGIMPKLYLINKNKLNLYAGLGFGLQHLKTSEDNGTVKSEAKYQGSNLHIRLGMNIYFTKFIGMFIHTGYDANTMNLKDFSTTIGNTTNSLSNLSGKLTANGIELALGLNFKFSSGN